jgi:hypothetical protein
VWKLRQQLDQILGQGPHLLVEKFKISKAQQPGSSWCEIQGKFRMERHEKDERLISGNRKQQGSASFTHTTLHRKKQEMMEAHAQPWAEVWG